MSPLVPTQILQYNPNGMKPISPPPINSTNCRQVPERFKLSAFNCSSPGTLFTNTGLLLGNVLVPGIPFLTLLPTEMVAVAWGRHSLNGQHHCQMEPGSTKPTLTSHSSKTEKENTFPLPCLVLFIIETQLNKLQTFAKNCCFVALLV